MALIYVVEDDDNIREIEQMALRSSNYEVKGFSNANDFFAALESVIADCVILDIMLPDKDGYQIIKELRSKKVTKDIPVIMVSAKTSEIDMIKGLDDGADDYIKKPFSVIELQSRVKSLLRRTTKTKETSLQVKDIFIDLKTYKVYVNKQQIELTNKEFQLLKYFMINKNIVLQRDLLMEKVWGTDYVGDSRTLDMHIKTLRAKLLTAGSYIKTIRNVGYMLEE